MRRGESIPRSQKRGKAAKAPFVFRVVATSILVSSVALLPGCKTSQTLTEILFDQESEQIDQSNQSRFLRNVLDSLDMTEELAEKLRKKTPLQRETTEEKTVAGKDDQEERVPQTSYDENASSQSESTEAGDGSTTSQSKKDGTSQGNSTSKGKNTSKKGSDSSSKGKTGKKASGDSGKGSGSGSSSGDNKVYHGNGGSGKTYGDDGTYTELPTGVQTVVAFGECANMVVSFAGEHALSGADAGFLSNSFIKSAYKSKDIANAKTVGISSKNVIDASKIIELKPDAVLLSGSRYKISSSDLKKLSAKKIDVVYLPDMASKSHIVKVAESIGKMFGSTTLSGDDAGKAADEYISWHDQVVAEAKGKTGELAGSKNFDTGKDNDGPEGNYTIYISDWDNATYYATPDNTLAWTDKNGVAISQVGYKWSPMSYYLSAGGTQNVSATFKSSFYDVTAKYYVWQFNLGRVPTVYDKNWSGRSIAVNSLKNSGVDDLLARTSDGTGLGSSNFPYVITQNQKVTSKMTASLKASAKSKTGLYAAYPSTRGTNGSGTGFLSSAGQYCSSCIAGSFGVETNPCGLYSSWIDGSPESVLEATWASDLNNNTSNTKTRVKEYYQLFYGVSLSSKQINAILSGKEG